jgi:hypothetical protein
VLISGNMNQFEVEKEDCGNPAIDGCVQLDVGVAEHTFDIAGIHFDCEIAYADKVEVHCPKHMEKTV